MIHIALHSFLNPMPKLSSRRYERVAVDDREIVDSRYGTSHRSLMPRTGQGSTTVIRYAYISSVSPLQR